MPDTLGLTGALVQDAMRGGVFHTFGLRQGSGKGRMGGSKRVGIAELQKAGETPAFRVSNCVVAPGPCKDVAARAGR